MFQVLTDKKEFVARNREGISQQSFNVASPPDMRNLVAYVIRPASHWPEWVIVKWEIT